MVRLASLAVLIPAVAAQGYYYGCYIETHGRTSVRTIAGASTTDYEEMSITECQTFCTTGAQAAAEYTVWGVEYGGECYCGHGFSAGAFPTFETSCNVDCPGAPTVKCGGGNRVSVYGSAETAPEFTPFPADGGPYDTFTYKGCYIDSGPYRALGDDSTTSSSMTNEACGNFCHWYGYKYSGTEWFSECWCAHEIHNTSSLATSESECNTDCAGDDTQKCGGGNRISISEWTLAPEPEERKFRFHRS